MSQSESSGSDKVERALEVAARQIDALLAAAVVKNTGVTSGFFGGVSIADIMDVMRRQLTPIAPSAEREPDGYAVLIDDKASSPKGYWFAYAYIDRGTAEKSAAVTKGRVEPIYFASSSAVPLVEKIEQLQRAVPPEEWDKLPRSSERSAIPFGWKLVPENLTEDMMNSLRASVQIINIAPPDEQAVYQIEARYNGMWSDVLNIAPSVLVSSSVTPEKCLRCGCSAAEFLRVGCNAIPCPLGAREFKAISSVPHERSNDPNLLADLSVALDDWLHQYAPEHCDDDQVRTRAKRIFDMGGTLYYLAGLQKRIRAAIEQPSATRTSEGDSNG